MAGAAATAINSSIAASPKFTGTILCIHLHELFTAYHGLRCVQTANCTYWNGFIESDSWFWESPFCSPIGAQITIMVLSILRLSSFLPFSRYLWWDMYISMDEKSPLQLFKHCLTILPVPDPTALYLYPSLSIVRLLTHLSRSIHIFMLILSHTVLYFLSS